MDGHKKRIQTVTGQLEFQDGVLDQSNLVLQRGMELAQQGANGTMNPTQRAQMAEEVFGLRDQLASLANSSYQGVYVFSGGADNVPAYAPSTTPYTNPATGPSATRYEYTTAPGSHTTRTVEVADSLSVRNNADGSTIFSRAIGALERLGRALAGYATGPALTTPTPLPDGTGNAYSFPPDEALQRQDIANTLDLLKQASQQDIGTERVSLGARLNQLKSASAVVDTTTLSAKAPLSGLQDTDVPEAATNLTQARTALEASMAVSGKVLGLSILNYL
jgi:flagellar hook-associated protein 3 FlgL